MSLIFNPYGSKIEKDENIYKYNKEKSVFLMW
jgi:hypothetical protein